MLLNRNLVDADRDDKCCGGPVQTVQYGVLCALMLLLPEAA